MIVWKNNNIKMITILIHKAFDTTGANLIRSMYYNLKEDVTNNDITFAFSDIRSSDILSNIKATKAQKAQLEKYFPQLSLSLEIKSLDGYVIVPDNQTVLSDIRLAISDTIKLLKLKNEN